MMVTTIGPTRDKIGALLTDLMILGPTPVAEFRHSCLISMENIGDSISVDSLIIGSQSRTVGLSGRNR